MKALKIKSPSDKTLAKYGYSQDTFLEQYRVQGGKCAVCRNPLEGKQVFLDHEHVFGYKTMSAQEKAKHVRGILDYQCNRFRVAKNTYLTAQAVVEYLEKHEDRKRRQAASLG